MKTLIAAIGTVALGLIAMTTLLDATSATAGEPPIPSTGGGLRPGSVPTQFEALVLTAGALCAAAPPSIIAAQIQQESGWNPNAVSPAGAEGISQFLPSTWRTWSSSGQSPFDPSAAIPAQGRYDCAIARTMTTAQARGQLPKTVDLTSLMLAGYNAGPGKVLAARGIPPIAETQKYVRSILTAAASFAGAPAAGEGAPSGSFAAREIEAARRYLGTPYAWDGGDYLGPTRGLCAGGAAANDCNKVGFDCSGLVMYAVFAASQGKIRLSHSADAQTRGGTPVMTGQLQPGDLLSFTDPGSSVAHHIGIYLGSNQLLNAPESGAVVRIDSLSTPYYRSQQWRAARYG